MTVSQDEHPKMLWAASTFLRQAKDRDHTQALRVLRHLVGSANVRIAAKASQALREYESEQARQEGVTK